jgi:hypothetical protein
VGLGGGGGEVGEGVPGGAGFLCGGEPGRQLVQVGSRSYPLSPCHLDLLAIRPGSLNLFSL